MPRPEDTAAAAPLDGITIVDASTSYAGPTASLYLADLGATIVKIERPGHGDDARHWGPPFRSGWSAWYASANAGKLSVALDYTTRDGRAALDHILGSADAFIHNLNPAKLERVGLDPATVAARHPDLVYCAISGFGLDGPDMGLPGYDLITQARSGLMSVTGDRGGDPQRVSTALTDIVAGLSAALAIAAALLGRQRGGGGTVVDVALLEVGTALMAPRIAAYLAGEPEPAPSGATDSVLSIYQTFDTADRPIAVAIGNDEMWKRLCRVLGLDDLAADPRFATNELRRSSRDEIVATIAKRFAERPAARWLEELGASRIPATPIQSLSEVVLDPQLVARGVLASVQTDDGASLDVVGPPFRVGGRPPARGAVRSLGADTVDVLRNAGLTDDDVAALVAAGVVTTGSGTP